MADSDDAAKKVKESSSEGEEENNSSNGTPSIKIEKAQSFNDDNTEGTI